MCRIKAILKTESTYKFRFGFALVDDNPPTYPRTQDDTQHLRAGFFCQDPKCNACLEEVGQDANGDTSYRKPETAVAHWPCFQLFSRRCESADSMRRLVWLAMARYVWPGMQNLELPAATDLVALHVLPEGMPGMASLPLELVQRVRSFSDGHDFWRYNSVCTLAAELSAAAPTKPVTVSLDDVEAWERGGELVVRPSASSFWSTMRLTIDWRGLRRIERWAGTPFSPAAASPKEKENKYVILHGELIEKAHFQVSKLYNISMFEYSFCSISTPFFCIYVH